ncbi:uncharacterized protein LOC124307179 isoform X2 [Neodiprion virginianus]|uniref:uncharacterized protein LOC124307179 isoform X2 n=1 Tax=Neodiprion virginianus TaxID=2961670 RepID=UPI001EE74810|nr:uncharacterized protein LOC124307179 isoform X2 [Neodiprion virginianus]
MLRKPDCATGPNGKENGAAGLAPSMKRISLLYSGGCIIRQIFEAKNEGFQRSRVPPRRSRLWGRVVQPMDSCRRGSTAKERYRAADERRSCFAKSVASVGSGVWIVNEPNTLVFSMK